MIVKNKQSKLLKVNASANTNENVGQPLRGTACLTITFSGGEVCHELAHVALLQHGLGVYPFVNLGKKVICCQGNVNRLCG